MSGSHLTLDLTFSARRARVTIGDQIRRIIELAGKDESGVTSIHLEGHTDSRPIGGKLVRRNPDVFRKCDKIRRFRGAECEAANNLLLSSMRGSTVYSEILSSLGLASENNSKMAQWYRSHVIISGRGQMRPFGSLGCGIAFGGGGRLDRRVEIVFSLKKE